MLIADEMPPATKLKALALDRLWSTHICGDCSSSVAKAVSLCISFEGPGFPHNPFFISFSFDLVVGVAIAFHDKAIGSAPQAVTKNREVVGGV